MAEVQVVRVKFTTEDSDLDKTTGKYQKLDAASEELVKDFRAMNAEAGKASASITALGNKTDQATKKATKSVKETTKELSTLDSGAKKVAGLIAGYFTFQALVSFGKQIIDATAQFEKFQAVLTNTLGSKALADATILQLTKFAAKTPFDVDQLIGSYVKLANQGFKPTENQLRQLGDLASSTGKSFDQLAEAVIDAQTGEFERLKEFGIRAQKEGDKVTFTFKGVKTTVDNTNDSIRNYVTSLGDAAGVSGSMAAESATLGGSISNLGDSFGQLTTVLGKIFAPAIKATISLISDLTASLTKSFETIDEQIKKGASDRLIEVTQQRDDFTKKEIDRLIKLGKTAVEIEKEVNQALLAENLKSFDAQDQRRELEFENRQKLVRRLEKLSLKQAGDLSGIGFFDEVAAAASMEGFKKALDDLNTAGLDNSLKNDIESYKKTLSGLEVEAFKINDVFDRLGKTSDQVAAAFDKQAEANKKRSKENEDLLKNELDNLAKLEKLAIDRAKTVGATEADTLRIQMDFNSRRENLYKRFGKTREIDYQFLLLREKQLEIEYSKFLESEDDARGKARIEARDQILKNIEQQLAAQKVLDTNYFNSRIIQEQEALLKGEITLEEYWKSVEIINKDAQRKELQDAIDADNEKLDVTKLSADQTIAINQDIADKQKQLNELEIDEFKKKEEAKTKAKKEEEAKRRELEQQTYELFVDIVNAGFEINQNRLAANLEELKYNTDQEIKLAGDNQARKDQINAAAAEKERALKRRQAEIDRNQAIFNIGITTALNVVKALGQPPIPGTNFIAAAIAAASGAAQLAVVLSKPLPKFAKGTKRVTGGQQGVDSVHALLMPDEAVIPADQAQHPNLKPIIGGLIDRTLDPRDIMIRGHKDLGKGIHRDEPLLKEMQGLRKEIKKLKQVNVTVDRSGVNVESIGNNSRTRILNNYWND